MPAMREILKAWPIIGKNITTQFWAKVFPTNILKSGIKPLGSLFAMLSKHTVFTLLICTQVNVLANEPIQFIDNPTIYISDTNGLKVNEDAQTTLESFVRNWSQFEILVDKNLFPIEAPNCQRTIQIRFKGIEPTKNRISQVQKSRWELLNRLRNSNLKDTTPIFLHLDTKHYIKKSANGKYMLDYCNVFVE
jgi:hypothetical protein